MPLKGSPSVGNEDLLKSPVVEGTVQGQHVVGLLETPPLSRELQLPMVVEDVMVILKKNGSDLYQ